MTFPSVVTTAAVWLANPAALLTMDPADGHSVRSATVLSGLDANMAEYGWLKLGEADITYTFDFDQQSATQAAVKTLQDKIADIQAKAQKEVTVLQEGINKLLAIGYTAPSRPTPAPAPHAFPDDDIHF